MARARVYLQTFSAPGVYTGEWVEATKDIRVGGVNPITENLDGSNFDLGIYRPPSLQLVLDNTSGNYSDVSEPHSIFAIKRSGALVKFTYDPSDYDFFANISSSSDIVGEERTIFIGVLNDESASLNVKDNALSFGVLGRDSIFDRILVPSSVYAGDTGFASDIIYDLLNQGPVLSLMTLDALNIVPGNDVEIDVPANLENKTVKEALNDLLVITNSVLYVDGDAIKVVGRTPTAAVQFNFYGQASTMGVENVLDLANVISGLSRTYNLVTWAGTAYSSNDESSVAAYGYRKAQSEFDFDVINDDITKQAILDATIDEFGSPKRELELTTALTLDTLGLSILDRVSLDYPELVTSSGNLPLYGVARYGESEYPTTNKSLSILPDDHYKIMGRTVDLNKFLIKFKLRLI